MEDTEDTQWSDEARQRYVSTAADLVAALNAHIALTVERVGCEREMASYFTSVDALGKAAEVFTEAEFDWCGSVPLILMPDDVEDEGDDDDQDEVADEAAESVLSVLRRWDFAVTDGAAVVQAGREAYRRAWPSATDEDAGVMVPDVEQAAAEIVHADGWAGLEEVAGWEMGSEWWTFIGHDGQPQGEDDEDPFAIARGGVS